MTRVQANLLLLFVAAIWGGGFVSQATALDKIGPLLFVSLRFGVAALAVLPFALWEKSRAVTSLTPASMKGFLFIGLALFGGAVTQQFGLLTTTVTNSGFLTGLYVIFVPMMSVAFFKKRPHWIIWPSASIAVAGIFLLSGGALSSLTQGDFLTVICAVFWAVQVLLVDVHGAGSGRPMALSVTQFAICSLGGLILALIFEPIAMQQIIAVLPEVLYSGILSSGLAFTLQVVAQRYTTAPQAAIFLAGESLFAALSGALFLAERISFTGYIGCMMLFAAMLAVELVPELSKPKAQAR